MPRGEIAMQPCGADNRRHRRNRDRGGPPANLLACTLIVTAVCAFFVWGQAASAANKEVPISTNLAALESRFFKHSYGDQTVDQRLSRLEELVFGETATGAEQERLARLLDATGQKPLLEAAGGTTGTTSQSAATAETQQRPQTSARNTDSAREVNQAAPPEHGQSSSIEYPMITRLETVILNRPYPHDQLRKRLDRLEVAAFGQPSGIVDLSERTDRLKNFAGLQAPDDDMVPLPTSDYLTFPDEHDSRTGILQEVGLLEESVFGRTYTSDPLLQRVSRLERSVNPEDGVQSSVPLPERLDQLRLAISKSQRPSISSAKRPIGSWQPSSSYTPVAQTNAAANSGQRPNASNNNTNNSNTSPNEKGAAPQRKHPWLRGLGKALEIAGQIALNTLGSSLGGGYYGGYGGLGGFGGYPYSVPPTGSGFGFGGVGPYWGGGIGFGAAPITLGGRYY